MDEPTWGQHRAGRGHLRIVECRRAGGKPCPRCEEPLPTDLDEWMASVYVDEYEVGVSALRIEPVHVACMQTLERKRLLRENPDEAAELGLAPDDELDFGGAA